MLAAHQKLYLFNLLNTGKFFGFTSAQNFKLPKNFTFFAPKLFKFLSDSLLEAKHKLYKPKIFFE